MAQCEYCSEPVSLPYTCSLCGNKYDGKHRLPESHECINLNKFQSKEYIEAKKTKKRELAKAKSGGYNSYSGGYSGESRVQSLTRNFWQASTPERTVLLAGLVLAIAMNTGILFQLLFNIGSVFGFSNSINGVFAVESNLQNLLTFLVGIFLLTSSSLYLVYLIRRRKADELGVLTNFLFWPIGVLITAITSILPFIFTWLAFGYFTNMGDEKSSTEVVKVSNYAYIGAFLILRILGYVSVGLLYTVVPGGLIIALFQSSTALLFYGGLMMIPWGRLDGGIFFQTDRNTYFVHLFVFIALIITTFAGF